MLTFFKVRTGFWKKITQIIQNRQKLPIFFAVECHGMKKLFETLKKWFLLKNNKWFSRKNLAVQKIVKSSKFCCRMRLKYWIFSLPWKLDFFKKMIGFFETKGWIFLKPLKFQRRKFAVKNDWEREVSQKVQKFGCLKRHMGFLKKLFSTFLKSLRVSNIP